jgi:V/A-type H+-transporting ATPase subunit I
MAITQMAKVMIITHRSEASELLEALQSEAICHVLNAQDAAVSRDLPERVIADERPKDIEQFLGRLVGSIAFLKNYAKSTKGLAGILAPRTVIDEKTYNDAVTDEQIPEVVRESLICEEAIEKAKNECDRLGEVLEKLECWGALETAVEDIGELETCVCWAGFLQASQLERLTQQLAELSAAIQTVGTAGNKFACIIVCLKTDAGVAQKLLRSAEFEPVNFEQMTGAVAELIREHNEQLEQTQRQLKQLYEEAATLSENLLKLQILHDHYTNLLNKEQTRTNAPATEATVVLEGWVKKRDYSRLEKIVSRFGASTVSVVEPVEGEEPPIEIENKNMVRPFEVITRLYGMPQRFEVDPTVFLAPFFALFFALCLTDAGYGIVIVALMIFLIKKMQGDKKLMWMLGICSAVTVVTGALTGGWFGDAIQQFLPALKPLRDSMVWFDPFERPMMFFGVSVVLGYIQVMAGLLIAFSHNLRRREYISSVCDQLTWLVLINSVVIFALSKAGVVRAETGGLFGKLALLPAVVIVLFSRREGGWGGRIGMGAYNLFSGIFYIGDVLSYLRLMALGMVTAGLAMATNIIARITLDIFPYGIGIVLAVAVLIGGHGFNIALSGLSAFVHTLRLQYVEFFPKFFMGGGRLFKPLAKEYKHIYINK